MGRSGEMVTVDNDNGRITISGEVFTEIVGDTATRCFGVKGMAGKSAEGGIYRLLRRESMSRGVSVKFNDGGGADVALHIVVDHGVNIPALGHSIINEVRWKVGEATGVGVSRVDVYVDSVTVD